MQIRKTSRLSAACTAMALGLGLGFAGASSALDLDTMTEAEREAFRAEVRAYLLDNPEVIMEAVAILEQREAAAQAMADVELVERNAKALFDDPNSWIGGNPDGKITMVEFMDYRCGFCRRAAPEVTNFVAENEDVRIIVKEFPILGEQSELASRFAISAKQQVGDDAYKAVHDALLAFNGDLSDTTLRRLSDSLALPTDKIMGHMDSDDVTGVIQANRTLAAALRIQGTPSFVMGDQLLRGYLTADEMSQVADQLRSEN